MKRISQGRRAAQKRFRNQLSRATPGDRAEVLRFQEMLRDPLAATDRQAAYDKHFLGVKNEAADND